MTIYRLSVLRYNADLPRPDHLEDPARGGGGGRAGGDGGTRGLDSRIMAHCKGNNNT